MKNMEEIRPYELKNVIRIAEWGGPVSLGSQIKPSTQEYRPVG